MTQELRNPPATDATWTFYSRAEDKMYTAKARTAWLAVKAHKVSFQDCDTFTESAA